MRVVAVILTYWPERVPNISEIKKHIERGTVVPDDLLILNNNPTYQFPSLGSAKIINSGFNSMTRGKYGVALMQPADYYLILDDDIAPGRRTLEALLNVANDTSCIAGRGIILDQNGSFWHGLSVSPHEIEVETVVDSLVGRLQFVSFQSILRMLEIEPEFRLDDGKFLYEAEDIAIGLANRSTILPLRGEECPIDVSERGVSLCQSVRDYAPMRDEVTRKILRSLVFKTYPELNEAPWRKNHALVSGIKKEIYAASKVKTGRCQFTRLDGSVHVYPVNDLAPHNLDGDNCPCNARVSYDGETKLIVHNSFDGRELVEKHGLQ